MSYGQYNNSSPYGGGPAAEDGHGNDQGQPQYGGGQYEMQPYGEQPQSPGAGTLTQQDFLGRIQHLRDEIRSLTADIEHIAQLHQRALASADSVPSNQLNDAVSRSQLRNTSIRNDIKFLERDAARTQDGSKSSKQAQLNSVKNTFKEELQSYMQMEGDYQRRYKDQIARQYRIVNPDASEEEVHQATEANWDDEGVFQTALKSNRVGQANSVLGNVRARHSELSRIERTLEQLAQLFQEMATLTEQQEPIVTEAEQNALQTTDNLKRGNEEVEVANKHARTRRKLKWWCFLVVVLIIIAIALGVGIGVGVAQKSTGN